MPLLIAAATLSVFGRVCGYGFTSWDDSFNIWLNPDLNPPRWETVARYRTLSGERRVDFFEDQVALGDVLVSLGHFGEAVQEYRTARNLRSADDAVARKLRRARRLNRDRPGAP